MIATGRSFVAPTSIITEAVSDNSPSDTAYINPSNPLNDAKGIESISPFAKVGVHYWEVDYTVTAGSTNYGTTTEDGWDMLWGLGAQINFDVNGMRFAVRGEFESTVIDDGDLEMFSGSLLYKF